MCVCVCVCVYDIGIRLLKCKQTKVNIYTFNSQATVRSPASEMCLRSDVKLGVFDPNLERLACLTTLKSCDKTKQSFCG